MKPIVIVHFNIGDPFPEYHVLGDVDLLIVDENAPHDRVYHYTTKSNKKIIKEILGSDEIGCKNDARHLALSARIEEALTGKKALKIVRDE